MDSVLHVMQELVFKLLGIANHTYYNVYMSSLVAKLSSSLECSSSSHDRNRLPSCIGSSS